MRLCARTGIEVFPFWKKEEEGNDNGGGIATTIRFVLVIITNIVDRYFSSHSWKKEGNDDTTSWTHPFIEEKTKKREEKSQRKIYHTNPDYKNQVEAICISFSINSC